jgi:hypothetical protein
VNHLPDDDVTWLKRTATTPLLFLSYSTGTKRPFVSRLVAKRVPIGFHEQWDDENDRNGAPHTFAGRFATKAAILETEQPKWSQRRAPPDPLKRKSLELIIDTSDNKLEVVVMTTVDGNSKFALHLGIVVLLLLVVVVAVILDRLVWFGSVRFPFGYI